MGVSQSSRLGCSGESMETLSRSWVLRRNCAMSPQQLLRVFLAIGLTSLAVSTAWALTGAWVVLPFMCLELLALAVAFLVYARHATDHERITLDPVKVSVEVVRGDRSDRQEIPREWLRCRLAEGRSDLVRIFNRQKELEVGRFVNQANRKKFLEEFQAALADGAFAK